MTTTANVMPPIKKYPVLQPYCVMISDVTGCSTAPKSPTNAIWIPSIVPAFFANHLFIRIGPKRFTKIVAPMAWGMAKRYQP